MGFCTKLRRRAARRTAADIDISGELPIPHQGIPTFADDTLRFLPVVQRPLTLLTAWLARLPAQSTPDGFHARAWTELLREWARRFGLGP